MKRLNRDFPTSPLNMKVRSCYNVKQAVNNSKMDESLKNEMMRLCDCEINRCWRNSYKGIKGYEIF